MLETLKQWDRELFVYLNGLGIERFDGFWIFVTQEENWAPLFALFIFLLFYFLRAKKGAIALVFLLGCTAATLFATDLTKEFIARLRPNNVEALSELIRILQKPTNYSFFSGHASSSFAITTFVVLTLREHSKLIFVAYIWPFIFVLSRIYVGVHYPSDLFVGALVGTFFAFLFYWIYTRLHARIGATPDLTV